MPQLQTYQDLAIRLNNKVKQGQYLPEIIDKETHKLKKWTAQNLLKSIY